MSKTITVRIPAVINPNGRWCAYGYPNAQKDPDWSMVEEVADNGDEPQYNYRRIWITAELPVPDDAEIEVEGVVEAKP